MLTGQNGILNKAQEAKNKAEISNQDEADKLSSVEALVQTAGTKVTNPSSYGENPNAQATADGAGNYFALPKNAKYIKGTVDNGVVVEIKGSQFVWVPVDDVVLDTNRTSQLPTSSDNGTSNGKTYTPMAVKVGNGYKGLLYNFDGINCYLKYDYTSENYGDPSILSYDTKDYQSEGITLDTLKLEYNAMIESVKKYNGFYVARYEAGIDKTTNEIVFKNANVEANNVTTTDASNSQTYSWYGLYKKMKTFATIQNNDDTVVSTMIWGSQYDAMMNWMAKTGKNIGVVDSSETNTNLDKITGSSTDDVINNIYDLYGCHREWTLTALNSSKRVWRGGFYNYNYPPTYNDGTNPASTDDTFSSRATLYIK